MTILDDTRAELVSRRRLAGRTLQAFYLTPYFTVVELDDGSVGAGMSYYRRVADVRRVVPSPSVSDPLLLRWLFDGPDPALGAVELEADIRLAVASLRVAVLGALSAPVILEGGDDAFVAGESPPPNLFGPGGLAVVVGFGGFIGQLASDARVDHLYVCDLGYAARREEMEREAEAYRGMRPDRPVTLSDGGDLVRWVRNADIVAVTGSALCNGTMDGILTEIQPGATVVVQGQSGAIHPLALFHRRVATVVTTVKPRELVRAAAADPTGRSLRPFLEGGLPWVYLRPLVTA